MDQQVSPAVVIIVLILIVAILVGLYFLVVERRPAAPEDEIINGVYHDEVEPNGAAELETPAPGDVDQEIDGWEEADQETIEAETPDEVENASTEDEV